MKNRMWVICLMGMVMAGNGEAKTDGGLILSGLDTLFTKTNYGAGFDFVLERPCSTSGDNACYPHFGFGWLLDDTAYGAAVGSPGRMLDIGKTNLDSIKSAPADSVMKSDLGLGQPYRFFKIAPDSLSKCIGNVYLLKTAVDPRMGYGYPLYAKIKILKFMVIDSAAHQIKMVFLWAYNDAGSYDLHTSGLDTFHLDGRAALPSSHQSTSHANLSSAIGKHFFTVATSRFTLPQSLLNANTIVTIYDLTGKTLCRLAPGNAGTIDLRRMGAGGKVFLISVQK